MDADSDDARTIAALQEAISSAGDRFFSFDRETSPLTLRPFPLTRNQLSELEKIGHRLFLFHQATGRIRKRSADGKLPPWIAATMNGNDPFEIPAVFSPNLYVTESGWSITGYATPKENLSLAAWLNDTYAALTPDSIVPAASPVLPPGAVDLEDDLSQRPSVVPFALLHLRSLRDVWLRELRGSQFDRLVKAIPYSWLVDPSPLPPQAVIPRLEVSSMGAVADFCAGERAHLILKTPRGVAATGRLSTDKAWRIAIHRALDSAGKEMHILQQAVDPVPVEHPVWNPETARIETQEVTVRLNPVYRTETKTATLAGILAALGGNVLAPCAVA